MKIARELGDVDEERFQLRNLAYVAKVDGYFHWAVVYNRQALYLAILENDRPTIAEIAYDIARLLASQSETLPQAKVLLEHALHYQTRSDAA
ncbi:MAG: hypothetical protein HC915_21600, partial [Anaerolineae bacterium]|nr:hypothetical protein [Anaerolineae bacterium]